MFYNRILARLRGSTTLRFAFLITAIFFNISVVAAIFGARALEFALVAHATDRANSAADELFDEFLREGFEGLEANVKPRLYGGDRRMRYAVVTADGLFTLGDESVKPVLARMPAEGLTGIVRDDKLGRDVVVIRRYLDGSLRLFVVDDLDSAATVRRIMAGSLLNVLLLTALVGGVAGYLASRYLLSRLDAITGTAEAIIAGDLSRRIPGSRSHDEFDRVRSTLNRMLDRISNLMANIHQVSTDIAHDLRTPLSRLRQRLERAGRDRDASPAIEAAIQEVDGILETFAALLRIAQLEGGGQRAGFRLVDLSDLLDTVRDTYEAVAEEGGRRLTGRITPGLRVTGDRDLLVQLFVNLVENAIRHTPDGTRIVVALERRGTAVVASVADDGPGIPPADRGFVFRRFYRTEASRSTPGSGLGLSVAAAIAELHGTTIELSDQEPGLRASLVFPEASQPSLPSASAA